MTVYFRPRALTYVVGIALAFVSVHPCSAGDWPGWRGPTGQGYTDEESLPLTWDGKTGENILWKTELHGGRKRNPEFSSPGWSCPIVWRDRLFLTTSVWPEGQSEKERRESITEQHVLCFQVADGKIVWSEELPRMKDVDGGVCCSPILYEDTVIVVGIGTPGLRALDKQSGKVKWEQSTKERNSMSTPVLVRIQDKVQLIHFAGGIQSLVPATR